VRPGADIDGSPPISEDPTIDPLDFTDFGGTTYDDLTASADVSFAGSQTFRRDEISPVVVAGMCAAGIPTNWGSPLDPLGPCGNHFPMVHVAGDLRLTEGQGQGILLVDGNLTVGDGFTFMGLAIVMGRVTVSGDGSILGAVLARGGPDGNGRSEIRDEGKILYSSCAVQQAQTQLSGVSTVPWRSWFEVIG